VFTIGHSTIITSCRDELTLCVNRFGVGATTPAPIPNQSLATQPPKVTPGPGRGGKGKGNKGKMMRRRRTTLAPKHSVPWRQTASAYGLPHGSYSNRDRVEIGGRRIIQL